MKIDEKELLKQHAEEQVEKGEYVKFVLFRQQRAKLGKKHTSKKNDRRGV